MKIGEGSATTMMILRDYYSKYLEQWNLYDDSVVVHGRPPIFYVAMMTMTKRRSTHVKDGVAALMSSAAATMTRK
jgi:hypothetical protein